MGTRVMEPWAGASTARHVAKGAISARRNRFRTEPDGRSQSKGTGACGPARSGEGVGDTAGEPTGWTQGGWEA